MCGRFTLTRSAAEVAEHFGLASAPELAARYNLAPTQESLFVHVDDADRRCAERGRFGLVPGWAKDVSIGSRLINARIESIGERRAFRAAFARSRCLVPADGFYEWQGPPGRRRPHHIALPDGALFAFAGLHARWVGPGAEVIDSFTIVTRPAEGAVAALHDRMPLILDPGDYEAWLARAPLAPGALEAFGQARAGTLVTRAVDPRVNDVRNDDPGCLAAPVEPQLPLFSG